MEIYDGETLINVSVGEIYGTGIAKVEQTQTSHESGGINEITVTLTNGQTFQFYVENGQEGGTAEHALRYDPQVLTAEEQAQARTNISAMEDTPVDQYPADSSENLITSGGVFAALNELPDYFVPNYAVTWNDTEKQIARTNIGAAGTDVATTLTAGLMSATDKANLDTLMDDYTSALTALGVI